MNTIIALYDRLSAGLAPIASAMVPLLARLTFAGVLLIYFWNSARTKLGEGVMGLFNPSDGAYIQIFPKVIEEAGYDFSVLGPFHQLVVIAGTWAELLLPLLIVIGLFTRLAALGMIGFVLVQSATDIVGHGVGGDDLGRWFDAASGALIVDQRSLWIFLLLTLVMMGGGALSLDRVLTKSRS
ncbi:MAG: DoxX family protein [Albidovulum sp.]